MIRFGIIGAGRIGHVHARSVAAHPEARLVRVCDPVAAAAEKLVSAYGAAACGEAEDVFNDPEIDAVIIGSPTPLHVDHVIAATRAGKAALCEKPIAMSSADEERLRAGLKGLKPRVLMGFNRRFDPNFARAHGIVAAGDIGEVEQLTIVSRDPAAPSRDYIAVSGGIFKDMTIHDFDMARFFLGDIVRVSATGQNLDPALADTGDYDAAVIVLTNTAGKVATIINSRHCATGYDQRLEAFGPAGSVTVENVRTSTVRLSKDHFSASQEAYLDFFLERYAAAYSRELDAFIDAYRNGADMSPSLDDAFKALRIAEAAEESARQGHPVEAR